MTTITSSSLSSSKNSGSNKDTSLITFDVYSNKDYHHAFNLEISLEEFIDVLLSDHNRNLRINFYQI